MFSGVIALLSRSLRVDTRAWGPHLARFGLMCAIYLSVVYIHVTGFMGGAPGLRFFGNIAWLNLIFLTLAGIGAFSSTITEEKEEETLGLLQMAGVDSLGLLLGKTGGRLLQALLLIAVQYPFTLLSITMGGVSGVQVQAAYISLTAYLLMLAGIGALCSTICQTSRTASRLMLLTLLMYWIVPLIAAAWASTLAENGVRSTFRHVLEFISSTCVFLQMGEVLTTARTESPFSNQAITNPALGLICFGLAWALFGVFSTGRPTQSTPRGLLTTGAGRFRWFTPGRPWSNSLAWKDFHFCAAGLAGILIRASLYLSLFILIWSLGTTIQGASQAYLAFLMFILPFDASLLISRTMQDEVRGQTIASLVMLPRSIASIVYAKLTGSLLGLAPGLVALFMALIGSAIVTTIWSAGGFVIFLYLPSAVLLPHLTAVIALRVRWGAVPIAIGAMYALQTAEFMLIGMLFFFAGPGNSEFVLVGVLGIINLFVCVACHFDVLRRFQKLAEQ